MNKPSNPKGVTSRVDVFAEFPETSRAIGALHHEIMRRASTPDELHRMGRQIATHDAAR